MLDVELTPEILLNIGETLEVSIPDVGSARRAEAVAKGLGYRSHAALSAALTKEPRRVSVDARAFSESLDEAGGGYDRMFVGAVAVQAIRRALAGHPDTPVGDLATLLDADPETWASPEAQIAGEDFTALVAHLRKPAFLRKLGRYPSASDIATAARRHTRGFVRTPAAVAAALHAGLNPLPAHIWDSGTPSFLIIPPQPDTAVAYPAWVGRLLAIGEPAKDRARSALQVSAIAGAFDPYAAETLVKALWVQAFGNHLEQAGLPEWRTYGRMLLADPDLAAFGLLGNDPAGIARTRSGLESLCGGGPLPGLKPGYTYVFEGALKKLLDKAETQPRLGRGGSKAADKARRRR